jgi:hypothetical protein
MLEVRIRWHCTVSADASTGSGNLYCVQVVNAACKGLASLAKHAESAAAVLTANAQNYFAAVQQCQEPSFAPAYFSRRDPAAATDPFMECFFPIVFVQAAP